MGAKRDWRDLSRVRILSAASPLRLVPAGIVWCASGGGWGWGGLGRFERLPGLLSLQPPHPLPEGPGLVQPPPHQLTAGRVEVQTSGSVQVAACATI